VEEGLASYFHPFFLSQNIVNITKNRLYILLLVLIVKKGVDTIKFIN